MEKGKHGSGRMRHTKAEAYQAGGQLNDDGAIEIGSSDSDSEGRERSRGGANCVPESVRPFIPRCGTCI